MKTMSENDLISRNHFDERVRRVVSVDKELSADYLAGVDMVLYLLSTEPPAVPHEMSAREYFKQARRLQNWADQLQRQYHKASEILYKTFDDDADSAIEEVEKWAREHPERSEE